MLSGAFGLRMCQPRKGRINSRYSVTQPDGKLLVGGIFPLASGVARPWLARLNADGFVDTAFNAMIGAGGGGVTTLLLRPDGRIIIGGDFTSVGGVARPGLAQLHPDGTLDTSFVPASSGAGKTLALQADGKLFIGGSDNNVGGVLHHGVVRLNPDGSNDAAIPVYVASSVNGIALQKDGRLIIVGGFGSNGTGPGSAARSRIARLARAAAWPSVRVPSSGICAWRTAATVGPMPGTCRTRAARAAMASSAACCAPFGRLRAEWQMRAAARGIRAALIQRFEFEQWMGKSQAPGRLPPPCKKGAQASGARGSSPSPPHGLPPVRRPRFTACFHSQCHEQFQHPSGVRVRGRFGAPLNPALSQTLS